MSTPNFIRVEVEGLDPFEVAADMPPETRQALVKKKLAEKNAVPPPEPRSVGGFVGNIGSSGGRFLGDIAGAVAHPIETGKVVGRLAGGAAQMAIPGEQGLEPNAQALIDLYKQRYGGWENLAKTLYEDPVGVLADLSTLATGGGAALKGLGMAGKAANLGRAAEVATTAGKVASTVGDIADPMRAITRTGAALTGGVKLPERLYESALKPSLSQKNIPRIPAQIATGLEESIVVSPRGADKVAGLVDDLNNKITAEIAAKKGTTVSPSKVAQRAEDIVPDWQNQVTPVSDVKAIRGAKKEFIKQHQQVIGVDANGKPIYQEVPIPVEKAQKIKQGTYVQLRKKYGELGSARTEAEKALARGLKEEIAAAIPEVASLNARESALLNLDSQLERAVSRIRNHQIFGIGTPIAAGGVGAMTGSSKAALAAGIIRWAVDSPGIKSSLAIAINKARKLNPGKYGIANKATALSRVQEYIDSLGAQPAEEPTP